MASLAILILPIIIIMAIVFLAFNVILLILFITTIVLGIKSLKQKQVKNSFIIFLTIFLVLGIFDGFLWSVMLKPEFYGRLVNEQIDGKEVTAVYYTDYEDVKKHLDSGWKPNEVENFMYEILVEYEEDDDIEANMKVLELLLQNGLDPNKPIYAAKTWTSPINLAVSYGCESAAILLIEYGADVNNEINQITSSPIHNLFFPLNDLELELFKLILSKDVDLNKVDYQGVTVIDFLEEELEMMTLQKEQGQNVTNYDEVKSIIEGLRIK